MGTGRKFIAFMFFVSCVGNHNFSVKFFIPADSSRCALDSCAYFENQFTVLCEKYETKVHFFVSKKDLEFTTRLASLLSLNGSRKWTSAYTNNGRSSHSMRQRTSCMRAVSKCFGRHSLIHQRTGA